MSCKYHMWLTCCSHSTPMRITKACYEATAAPLQGKSGEVCAVCSWQMRISAMKAARRAYAKALHLAPGQGSLWGDVSATFYHEAQLRRAHPKLDPNQAHHLRGTAETLMRGRSFHQQPLPAFCLVPFCTLHSPLLGSALVPSVPAAACCQPDCLLALSCLSSWPQPLPCVRHITIVYVFSMCLTQAAFPPQTAVCTAASACNL